MLIQLICFRSQSGGKAAQAQTDVAGSSEDV